eukprot:CAMPEP_0178464446 /NCGR_PEP_ID=MMETSP0689_2-20121128/50846_1 /TAXON_ID=160604 /ORGANISM="Amphidinium massartii, Strain CS-259" /LENGTH=530 /DNA_ID=CAMNT_0020091347 /DNA_START=1 /DNA_END=1590 /DNA_ORIENTATION=-
MRGVAGATSPASAAGHAAIAAAVAVGLSASVGIFLLWRRKELEHELDEKAQRQRGAQSIAASTASGQAQNPDIANSMEEAELELEDLVMEEPRLPMAAGRQPQVALRQRASAATGTVDSSEASGTKLPGCCAHNSSDSEFMMGLLKEYGYNFVDTVDEADICLLNSCTVKNPSQDTAVNLARKAQEAGKQVIMSGCVPSADAALADSLTGISLLEVSQIDRIVEVVEEAVKGHVVRLLGKKKALPSLELPKVRRNRLVEIIPISAGCLGNCSYCKTKHARGKLNSYRPEDIVNRARAAAAEGVKEVWLTSEDTGAYGLDMNENIAGLLQRVADAMLELGVMVKLGMTNPPYMLAHIDAVAEVLLRPNVFEFIHIPVQSGSDQVLRAMVREYTSGDFRRLVDGLRSRVPDLLVATDIICGFPTEGDADHQDTLQLVKDYHFPVLNISQYYPRPGTAAAKMRKLPGDVVKRRSTEVTNLFTSYQTYDHLPGKTVKVWFCESDEQRGQTVGHTKAYCKVIVARDDSLLGSTRM